MSNESPCHHQHQHGDDDVSEDNNNRECDGDLEHGPAQRVVSNVESAYLESNNSKKQLFVMCYGLTEDRGTTPLLDLDTEPWKAIKKQDIKPSRMEYAEEIMRRSTRIRFHSVQ